MDAQSFWTAVFVGIAALAFLVQGLALLGIYSRLKQVTASVDDMSADVKKKLAAVTDSVQQSVDAARPLIEGVQKLNENLLTVSVLARDRAQELDRLAQEATETLRAQLVRVDDVVDTTAQRVHHAVETWHRSVIAPAHELTALVRAFKTGLNFFFSRRESRDPSRTQPDEELFI